MDTVRAWHELHNRVFVHGCYTLHRSSSSRIHRLNPYHVGRGFCSNCLKITLQLGIVWIVGSRRDKKHLGRMHASNHIGGRNATLRVGQTLSHYTSDAKCDAIAGHGAARMRGCDAEGYYGRRDKSRQNKGAS